MAGTTLTPSRARVQAAKQSITRTRERAVELLKEKPDGLALSELLEDLASFGRPTVSRALSILLTEGRIEMTGERVVRLRNR